MSSPFVNCVSSINEVEGEEAIAAKLLAVRNVSSLTKSNPRNPVLAVVPVILMSMNDVGRLFHSSSERCNAVRASATERNAVPIGFGIGSSVVFMLYCTGNVRASHLMPTTRANIWFWNPVGTRPVMSICSSAPPARTGTTPTSTSSKHKQIAVILEVKEAKVFSIIDSLGDD